MPQFSSTNKPKAKNKPEVKSRPKAKSRPKVTNMTKNMPTVRNRKVLTNMLPEKHMSVPKVNWQYKHMVRQVMVKHKPNKQQGCYKHHHLELVLELEQEQRQRWPRQQRIPTV